MADRVISDCRKTPSVKNCTLVIEGSEDEVTRVATRHAIDDHGHEDSPQLRDQVKSSLEPAIV